MTNIQINFNNTINQGEFSPPPLDTLAQLGTNTKKTLRKRARAKYLTNEIVFALADLDSPLHQSYWNSYHCASVLLQDGKKLTGKYCNNRWCRVCNRIRSAKLRNGYFAPLKELKDPHMVTLTVPAVSKDSLRTTAKGMIKSFNVISNLFRHRRGIKVTGLRKLESGHNLEKHTFNPHFHTIVDGKDTAEALVNEWLRLYPDAERWCQDIEKADDSVLKEIFKYVTKGGKDKITRHEGHIEYEIHPKEMDVIFQAFRGLRIYQPLGGFKKVAVSEDIEELQAEEYEDLRTLTLDVWGWEHEISDWTTADGECLTGCKAYKHYKILRL